ncbi:MAG: hypothetical protein U0K87_00395 [Ruminococcus sp.]|nr:hypothetical protein [Acutalibacteraceae bacterium]MEE1170793.1 hypothetical protein [Ruminococcus sp.]
MNIKYKGNELEVRGGAWCDPMNGFAFNVLEREVIDDNKTGRYDVCVTNNPITGEKEYFAIRTY